jgi:WD40 repeat protein
MSRTSPFFAAFNVAVLAALAHCSAQAEVAAVPARPWLEPVSTRSIAVPEYETTSTSPYGGWRSGGSDRRSFAISPNGKVLVTQDAGVWRLELWDLQEDISLSRFGKILDPVTIAVAPGGNTLVTASWDRSRGGPVELWDLESRRLVRALDEGVNFTLFTALAFSADGKTLALATAPAVRPGQVSSVSVHLWDANSGEELQVLGEQTKSREPAPRRVFRSISVREAVRPFGQIAFAPDGRSLAVAADDRVTLVEIASGQQRATLARLPSIPDSKPYDSQPQATAITFSRDGRVLAVGCHDGLIRLYDVVADRPLLPLSGHAASVVALRALPDGDTLLSFGRDNRLSAWDLAAARQATFPQLPPLTVEAFEPLWQALRDGDQQSLHRAGLILAASPGGAALLSQHIGPVPRTDTRRLAALAEAIGSEDYNQRRQAAVELRKHGDLAIPALQAAASAAMGRNEMASDFLVKLQSEHPTAEQIRRLRALDVLAEIDNADARHLLGELAAGVPESSLTQQAGRIIADASAKNSPVSADATLDALWGELAGEDAARAWSAIRALGQRADARDFVTNQLAVLQRRLALDDDPQRISKLIEQLNADEFVVREAASAALQRRGKEVHPELRKSLTPRTSPEVRLRIENLLQSADEARPSKERLQAERALETLYLIKGKIGS